MEPKGVVAARVDINLPTYVQFERKGDIALSRLMKIFFILGQTKAIAAPAAEKDFSVCTLDDIFLRSVKDAHVPLKRAVLGSGVCVARYSSRLPIFLSEKDGRKWSSDFFRILQ